MELGRRGAVDGPFVVLFPKGLVRDENAAWRHLRRVQVAQTAFRGH